MARLEHAAGRKRRRRLSLLAIYLLTTTPVIAYDSLDHARINTSALLPVEPVRYSNASILLTENSRNGYLKESPYLNLRDKKSSAAARPTRHPPSLPARPHRPVVKKEEIVPPEKSGDAAKVELVSVAPLIETKRQPVSDLIPQIDPGAVPPALSPESQASKEAIAKQVEQRLLRILQGKPVPPGMLHMPRKSAAKKADEKRPEIDKPIETSAVNPTVRQARALAKISEALDALHRNDVKPQPGENVLREPAAVNAAPEEKSKVPSIEPADTKKQKSRFLSTADEALLDAAAREADDLGEKADIPEKFLQDPGKIAPEMQADTVPSPAPVQKTPDPVVKEEDRVEGESANPEQPMLAEEKDSEEGGVAKARVPTREMLDKVVQIMNEPPAKAPEVVKIGEDLLPSAQQLAAMTPAAGKEKEASGEEDPILEETPLAVNSKSTPEVTLELIASEEGPPAPPQRALPAMAIKADRNPAIVEPASEVVLELVKENSPVVPEAAEEASAAAENVAPQAVEVAMVPEVTIAAIDQDSAAVEKEALPEEAPVAEAAEKNPSAALSEPVREAEKPAEEIPVAINEAVIPEEEPVHAVAEVTEEVTVAAAEEKPASEISLESVVADKQLPEVRKVAAVEPDPEEIPAKMSVVEKKESEESGKPAVAKSDLPAIGMLQEKFVQAAAENPPAPIQEKKPEPALFPKPIAVKNDLPSVKELKESSMQVTEIRPPAEEWEPERESLISTPKPIIVKRKLIPIHQAPETAYVEEKNMVKAEAEPAPLPPMKTEISELASKPFPTVRELNLVQREKERSKPRELMPRMAVAERELQRHSPAVADEDITVIRHVLPPQPHPGMEVAAMQESAPVQEQVPVEHIENMSARLRAPSPQLQSQSAPSQELTASDLAWAAKFGEEKVPMLPFPDPVEEKPVQEAAPVPQPVQMAKAEIEEPVKISESQIHQVELKPEPKIEQKKPDVTVLARESQEAAPLKQEPIPESVQQAEPAPLPEPVELTAQSDPEEAAPVQEVAGTSAQPAKTRVAITPSPTVRVIKNQPETGGEDVAAVASKAMEAYEVTKILPEDHEPKLSQETHRILEQLPSGIGELKPRKPEEPVDVARTSTPDMEVREEKVALHDAQGVKIQIKRPSININRYMEEGYNALMSGDLGTALGRYQAVLERDPLMNEAKFGLATTYHRMGELVMARDIYSDILTKEPNNLEVLNNLLVLVGQESPREALTELKKLAQRNPHFSPIPAQMAAIYAQMKEFDAAIESIRQAVRIDPGNLAYRYNQAVLMDRAGRREGAIALYVELKRAYDRGQDIPADIAAIQERLTFLLSNRG